MSKPPAILELEKVYGITLTETKDEKDIMNNSYETLDLYFLNKENQVIGLNLNHNEISEIKDLERFTNLQRLDIRNNQISEIKNLDKLTNLQRLGISFNQISEIKNLDKLINLKKLYISNNQISEIKNLDKLINLLDLDIRHNQISEIKNLDKLINLKKLYISNNQISEIKNLDKLINLLDLDIRHNQITEIKNLDKLQNLQELFIHHNRISEIKNLDKLINLQKLTISHNQILEIKNLDKIQNLQNLSISDNKISEIKSLDKLIKLQNLSISRNYITEIKILTPLLGLERLSRLSIFDNPFVEKLGLVTKPGENHLDIIRSELQKLKELEKKSEIIQLPVKVMLLGNHASGKSTLLHYLQTQQCSKVEKDKNNSTHILSVVHSKETINYDLPKAIYYDFGGQDYYHGIYQAFFTNEAVNMLVWNPKSDSNELLEKDSNNQSIRNYNRMYWLTQLKYSFLKRFDTLKTYNDKLLMIQTHADKQTTKNNWNEAFDKNHVIDEFHISLNITYENARNEAVLNYLTATFWDVVENQSSKKAVPEWYPEFLKYILNKENSEAISLDTIVKYYKREELSLVERKKYLRADLVQLARKGMLLYYKNDELLQDVAWLNPSATVAKIHETILSKEKIQKNKGKLTRKEFQTLDVTDKIKRLLLKEKILFYDKDFEEYIIPNYLPLTSEDAEMYDLLKFGFNKPMFVLKFERFIPFGLINQLICHYGQNPDKKHYWRDQLIFTLNDQFKVWIQLDFSKLTISVSIKPKTSEDNELSHCIQEIFIGIILLYWGKDLSRIKDTGGYDDSYSDEYEKGVTKLEQYKKIFKDTIKPDDLYLSTDGEYFVHYNTLDNPEKTQETILSFPLLENNLDKILGETQRSNIYRNFAFANDFKKKMKKIFISYSRKDVEYKDELRKHLNMLKLFDVADNWSCEDITIGKWHDQIQKELEESDLVIFMLSINFFNSRYIIENEVLKTMNTIANGSNKKVYCIIVSEFPRLEKFDKEGLSESQSSILQLGDYQFGSYVQERNTLTDNKEERIMSLKEAKRKGILDIQLTQIAEKILDDIK